MLQDRITETIAKITPTRIVSNAIRWLTTSAIICTWLLFIYSYFTQFFPTWMVAQIMGAVMGITFVIFMIYFVLKEVGLTW